MSNYLNAMKKATNYTLTENGGVAHKTTGSNLYDMFANCGAYRPRSDADCILLFKKAFAENPTYALRCLFYNRDILEGQGERRFFRVVIKWLANEYPEIVRHNIKNIPFFGRWDDLYSLVDTPASGAMWQFIREQLALDVESKTPSLLAKWLKSENTSSTKSCALGNKTRQALGMSHKQYRKTLSILRERINVLERLMSAREWDKIEFDKIPSKAGMVYRNAFARHDVERMRKATLESLQSYEDFAKDKNTKVNAKALYPYEVVAKAYNLTHDNWSWNKRRSSLALDNTERLMINKYWDNCAPYIDNLDLNALCVVDTSGSMWGSAASAPINIAISLGLIAAEKAHGPFYGHYISFSSTPQLISTDGVDFVDKVERIYSTNLCENTNLEAVFNMLLSIAVEGNIAQDDLPESIIVISDMQIDNAQGYWQRVDKPATMMENMRKKWAAYGYTIPHLVYWCVDSRKDTILDDGPNITYCSGSSGILFKQIAEGKNGYDLMMDKLNSKRYERIVL